MKISFKSKSDMHTLSGKHRDFDVISMYSPNDACINRPGCEILFMLVNQRKTSTQTVRNVAPPVQVIAVAARSSISKQHTHSIK